MPGSEPTNHHYVPRYYLRNFGVPDRPGGKAAWVSAYDRQFGHTHKRKSIRTVASEPDFYTLDVPAGQDPYALEKQFFGNVDTLGSQLITRILSQGTVSYIDRSQLREHLAVQIVRTKWFRDYVREQAPKVWQTQEAMRMASAGPPDHLTENQKEIWWKLVEEMPSEGWDILQDPNAVTMIPIGRFQKFRDGLEQFNSYSLAWLPDSLFLTSDNPILLRHMQSGFLGSPMHIGLNEASELWYPLSPQFSLSLSREMSAGTTTIHLDYQRVIELNNALAANSHRWTIWKPDTSAGQSFQPPASDSRNGQG